MLDYASFPNERQALIRNQLIKLGRVSSVKLAKELQVSEHTIRRDLQGLAKEGVCKKVYGGAVSLAPASTEFNKRIELDSDSKRRLGRGCAKLLRNSSCVFLDSGSTNLAVAKEISPDQHLTIVTSTPIIALELLRLTKCEIILIGGKLSKANGSTLGVTSLREIEGMYFDQCIMGACALDVNEGLTVFEYEDAEIKRTLLQQSNEVLVPLTKDKVNSVARYKVADCEEISSLVFDNDVPEEKLALFEDKKIHIHVLGE